MGHQLKDCEAIEDLGEEGFKDLEEKETSYGVWLRASRLPKVAEDQRKKDITSGSCSKSLFNVSSSHNHCGTRNKTKEGEEGEVEEDKSGPGSGSGMKAIQGTDQKTDKAKTGLEIEAVAESLGEVGISTSDNRKEKTK